MLCQRHVRVTDLYQTDLERHLFAPAREPGEGWRVKIGIVVADLRERWMGGWISLQTAMADAAFFL